MIAAVYIPLWVIPAAFIVLVALYVVWDDRDFLRAAIRKPRRTATARKAVRPRGR